MATNNKTPSPTCDTCGINPADREGGTCANCDRAPNIFAEVFRRRMTQLGLTNQDQATDSFNETVWDHLRVNLDPELAGKIAASKRPDLPLTKAGLIYWLRGNTIDPVWWPALATWLGVDTVDFYVFQGHVRLGNWAQVDEMVARWFEPPESLQHQQKRYSLLVERLDAAVAQIERSTSEVIRLRADAAALAREQGIEPGDSIDGADQSLHVPNSS